MGSEGAEKAEEGEGMKTRKALIVLGLAFCAGCDTAPVAQTAKNGCEIHDYGRGVFYFGCAGGFGYALSEFRGTHKVLSVTSYSITQYGTSGYWVVAE